MQAPPFKPNGLLDEADTKYFTDNLSSESAGGGSHGEMMALRARAKDMLLRDNECGEEILEVRKRGAFRGYTYVRPYNMGPRKSLFAY